MVFQGFGRVEGVLNGFEWSLIGFGVRGVVEWFLFEWNICCSNVVLLFWSFLKGLGVFEGVLSFLFLLVVEGF